MQETSGSLNKAALEQVLQKLASNVSDLILLVANSQSKHHFSDSVVPPQPTVIPAEIKERPDPKRIAEILDVKTKTIYNWLLQARNNSMADGIPFVRIPGSRFIRFSPRKVTEWYSRGEFKKYRIYGQGLKP